MWSESWCVRLGEGGRLMTDSQIEAAVARCWIDPETPVLEPGTDGWTRLGDALPDKCRITEERVVGDVTTSAITILTGEYEVISEGPSTKSAPRPPSLTKDELASARPPSLAPKLVAFSLVALATGGLLAHRYVPSFDGRVRDAIAAIGAASTNVVQSPKTEAPMLAVTPPPATAPVAVVPAPVADLAPKMREPSAPPASLASAPVSVAKREQPLAGKTTAKATHTKKKAGSDRKHKHRAGRT